MVFDGDRKIPKLRWDDPSDSLFFSKFNNNSSNNQQQATRQRSFDQNNNASRAGRSNSASTSPFVVSEQYEAWQQEVQEIKNLCRCCAIKIIEAPAEGEAECARLVNEDIADYVFSSDSDSLVFGAKNVIRYPRPGMKVTVYDDDNNNNNLSTTDPKGKRSKKNTKNKTIPIPKCTNAIDRYVCVTRIPPNDPYFSRESCIMFALLQGGDHDNGLKDIGTVYSQGLSFPSSRFAKRLYSLYTNDRFCIYNHNSTNNDSRFLGNNSTFLTKSGQDVLNLLKREMLGELKENTSRFFKKKINNSTTIDVLDKFPNEHILMSYIHPAKHKDRTIHVIERGEIYHVFQYNIPIFKLSIFNDREAHLTPIVFLKRMVSLFISGITKFEYKLIHIKKEKKYSSKGSANFFKSGTLGVCNQSSKTPDYLNQNLAIENISNSSNSLTGYINCARPEYYYATVIVNDIFKAFNKDFDADRLLERNQNKLWSTSEPQTPEGGSSINPDLIDSDIEEEEEETDGSGKKSNADSNQPSGHKSIDILIPAHILKACKYDYLGEFEKEKQAKLQKKTKKNTTSKSQKQPNTSVSNPPNPNSSSSSSTHLATSPIPYATPILPKLPGPNTGPSTTLPPTYPIPSIHPVYSTHQVHPASSIFPNRSAASSSSSSSIAPAPLTAKPLTFHRKGTIPNSSNNNSKKGPTLIRRTQHNHKSFGDSDSDSDSDIFAKTNSFSKPKALTKPPNGNNNNDINIKIDTNTTTTTITNTKNNHYENKFALNIGPQYNNNNINSQLKNGQSFQFESTQDLPAARQMTSNTEALFNFWSNELNNDDIVFAGSQNSQTSLSEYSQPKLEHNSDSSSFSAPKTISYLSPISENRTSTYHSADPTITPKSESYTGGRFNFSKNKMVTPVRYPNYNMKASNTPTILSKSQTSSYTDSLMIIEEDEFNENINNKSAPAIVSSNDTTAAINDVAKESDQINKSDESLLQEQSTKTHDHLESPEDAANPATITSLPPPISNEIAPQPQILPPPSVGIASKSKSEMELTVPSFPENIESGNRLATKYASESNINNNSPSVAKKFSSVSDFKSPATKQRSLSKLQRSIDHNQQLITSFFGGNSSVAARSKSQPTIMENSSKPFPASAQHTLSGDDNDVAVVEPPKETQSETSNINIPPKNIEASKVGKSSSLSLKRPSLSSRISLKRKLGVKPNNATPLFPSSITSSSFSPSLLSPLVVGAQSKMDTASELNNKAFQTDTLAAVGTTTTKATAAVGTTTTAGAPGIVSSANNSTQLHQESDLLNNDTQSIRSKESSINPQSEIEKNEGKELNINGSNDNENDSISTGDEAHKPIPRSNDRSGVDTTEIGTEISTIASKGAPSVISETETTISGDNSARGSFITSNADFELDHDSDLDFDFNSDENNDKTDNEQENNKDQNTTPRNTKNNPNSTQSTQNSNGSSISQFDSCYSTPEKAAEHFKLMERDGNLKQDEAQNKDNEENKSVTTPTLPARKDKVLETINETKSDGFVPSKATKSSTITIYTRSDDPRFPSQLKSSEISAEQLKCYDSSYFDDDLMCSDSSDDLIYPTLNSVNEIPPQTLANATPSISVKSGIVETHDKESKSESTNKIEEEKEEEEESNTTFDSDDDSSLLNPQNSNSTGVEKDNSSIATNNDMENKVSENDNGINPENSEKGANTVVGLKRKFTEYIGNSESQKLTTGINNNNTTESGPIQQPPAKRILSVSKFAKSNSQLSSPLNVSNATTVAVFSNHEQGSPIQAKSAIPEAIANPITTNSESQKLETSTPSKSSEKTLVSENNTPQTTNNATIEEEKTINELATTINSSPPQYQKATKSATESGDSIIELEVYVRPQPEPKKFPYSKEDPSTSESSSNSNRPLTLLDRIIKLKKTSAEIKLKNEGGDGFRKGNSNNDDNSSKNENDKTEYDRYSDFELSSSDLEDFPSLTDIKLSTDEPIKDSPAKPPQPQQNQDISTKEIESIQPVDSVAQKPSQLQPVQPIPPMQSAQQVQQVQLEQLKQEEEEEEQEQSKEQIHDQDTQQEDDIFSENFDSLNEITRSMFEGKLNTETNDKNTPENKNETEKEDFVNNLQHKEKEEEEEKDVDEKNSDVGKELEENSGEDSVKDSSDEEDSDEDSDEEDSDDDSEEFDEADLSKILTSKPRYVYFSKDRLEDDVMW